MPDRDEDLPADARFRPLPPIVDVHVPIRCALCPADGSPCPVCGGPRVGIAMGQTISEQAQRDLVHNRARYAELQSLRLGLPNRYAETRYRHGRA